MRRPIPPKAPPIRKNSSAILHHLGPVQDVKKVPKTSFYQNVFSAQGLHPPTRQREEEEDGLDEEEREWRFRFCLNIPLDQGVGDFLRQNPNAAADIFFPEWVEPGAATQPYYGELD
ncbi:hypothetical protein TWF730_002598 [Orbilia blumenaviensis]|uniref:Uncharacterized protein n=1 Tax=Orbilia blumenaviensis TaxID=1796055 RepID=A0AAV9UAH0_9PEZI